MLKLCQGSCFAVAELSTKYAHCRAADNAAAAHDCNLLCPTVLLQFSCTQTLLTHLRHATWAVCHPQSLLLSRHLPGTASRHLAGVLVPWGAFMLYLPACCIYALFFLIEGHPADVTGTKRLGRLKLPNVFLTGFGTYRCYSAHNPKHHNELC